MDMSATSRIVPLSDVASHVVAKTDSEPLPEEKRVTEVKDTTASDLQARHQAPQDNHEHAEHNSNIESGYRLSGRSIIYEVAYKDTGETLLEIPMRLASEESERAYAEQQRLAEARKEEALQEHQEIVA